MTPHLEGSELTLPTQSRLAHLEQHVGRAIGQLIAMCPDPDHLSDDARRGIIARYTAVLEGNFIYWMTATYLASASATAHAIIEDNLREEVRDNHPGMLRRFAIAARAVPTDVDAEAVHRPLQEVRAFVSGLAGMPLVAMMAFFEGFITRFMPYLADLAAHRGSTESEYTDVHGVVDIEHTQGLFRALGAEMDLGPVPPRPTDLLAGVDVLRALIEQILLHGRERDVRRAAGVPRGVAA
jgi:hypothetical protein